MRVQEVRILDDAKRNNHVYGWGITGQSWTSYNWGVSGDAEQKFGISSKDKKLTKEFYGNEKWL